MKQEIVHLQESNAGLNSKTKMLEEESLLFQEKVAKLQADNASLKAEIDNLNQSVKSLSDSEATIKNLLNDLSIKAQSGSDTEMVSQIGKLQRLQAQTRSELKDIQDRLNILELSSKHSPLTGIFSYIDNVDYQSMFIAKVEDALKQEMTYSQTDNYLSTVLPADLDKIIKDHPSLTRNYIRQLRRD